MPLAYQYPEFYQEWKRQNGEENALRDALLGAKAMKATSQDLIDYMRRSFNTALGILENINNQQ